MRLDRMPRRGWNQGGTWAGGKGVGSRNVQGNFYQDPGSPQHDSEGVGALNHWAPSPEKLVRTLCSGVNSRQSQSG